VRRDIELCVIIATLPLLVVHRATFTTSIPSKNVLSIRVGAGAL